MHQNEEVICHPYYIDDDDDDDDDDDYNDDDDGDDADDESLHLVIVKVQCTSTWAAFQVSMSNIKGLCKVNSFLNVFQVQFMHQSIKQCLSPSPPPPPPPPPKPQTQQLIFL